MSFNRDSHLPADAPLDEESNGGGIVWILAAAVLFWVGFGCAVLWYLSEKWAGW